MLISNSALGIRNILSSFSILLLCITYWTGSNTIEVLRPRGVQLSKKNFYEPTKDFSCLDGSGLIPFHFVNDDYCDCEDGSDEPGTAACIDGIFHCVNAGHVSRSIPSSHVNDRICDCCDGSDEYNSTSDCLNICLELGKQAREEALKQHKLYERGYTFWKDNVQRGKTIKENNKIRLENLKKSEVEAEQIKNEKETMKNESEEKEKAALAKYEILKEEKVKEAEELEMQQHQEKEKKLAEEAFKDLDKNQDGMLTYDEMQQFSKFDNNHDGVVSEEEAKFFLHMKDSMDLNEFITTGWMIMKPIYMIDKIPETISVPSVSEIITPMPAIYETEIGDLDEPKYSQHDELSEETLDDDDDENDQDSPPDFPSKETYVQKTGTTSEEPAYDEDTQKHVNDANAARNEFKEASDNLEKIRDEIKQILSDIEADFGPEEEFAVLKGQCFDFDDREYTYRFCPFDKASQIPKSRGSEISLGKWGFWAGPENNKYSKMKFENGQVCWNGPTRSTMVLLQCGVENKVLSTSEPNRCEYLFEFSTPSLCSSREFEQHKIHEHTEL